MAKTNEIKSILVLGSGPTAVGQGTEYSRVAWKACKLFSAAGYKVSVLDSNPASLALERDAADSTHTEPLTADIIRKVIAKERPDAIFPLAGGQQAYNLCVQLADELQQAGVAVLSVTPEAVRQACDGERFGKIVEAAGGKTLPSRTATTREEAAAAVKELGLPVILKPFFQVAGTGTAIVYNLEELKDSTWHAIKHSPVGRILVEKSILGWREITCQVIRDQAGASMAVGIIEDVDPVGVHSGDSVSVFPAQTLTPEQTAAIGGLACKIADAAGIVGTADIEFAINPAKPEDMVVVEMNPGITRFSALISFATGLMLIEAAVRLALGEPLSAVCPEPLVAKAVAVRVPKFSFDKFPAAKRELTTSMKSIGESCGLGSTFREALQKAMREPIAGDGFTFNASSSGKAVESSGDLRARLAVAQPERYALIKDALEQGISAEDIAKASSIERFFIAEIATLIGTARLLSQSKLTAELLRKAKAEGFSDSQIARTAGRSAEAISGMREGLGILPGYASIARSIKYASFETPREAADLDKRILMIGPGPNAIGAGSEYEYCLTNAAITFRELGYSLASVNCNVQGPTSNPDLWDELYIVPLSEEEVLDVARLIKPDGISVQFGGPVAVRLSETLEQNGFKILGTAPASHRRCKDRNLRRTMLTGLEMLQPEDAEVDSLPDAIKAAEQIGYPLVVRAPEPVPGKTMDVAYNPAELENSVESFQALNRCTGVGKPLLISEFLEDAIEMEIDAITDGTSLLVGGIIEHIEEAGVHPDDSACAIPPYTVSESVVQKMREHAAAIATALEIQRMLNVQFAIKNDLIYVTEVLPSASLTVPFVSLATGQPLVSIAAKVTAGISLKKQNATKERPPKQMYVRETVFPFARFPGVDAVLGPDMKSTGQVIGVGKTLGPAFAKASIAAGQKLPVSGKVFISLKNKDKRPMLYVARKLQELGFTLTATRGTALALQKNGVDVELISKVSEGRPNIVDLIKNNDVGLIINTPSRKAPTSDEVLIRASAVAANVPILTTVSGAAAAVNAIEVMIKRGLDIGAM